MAFTSSRKHPPGSAAASIGCLVFFGLFWSAITLTFDGVIGWGAFRQIQATGFPTAPGRVTQSSVESHRGSKGGLTYSPKILYAYQVAGKQYHCDRYRYGQMSSNDDNARRIVEAFPVGRTIDVFYAPDDPANAVLKTGLEGTDLFMATFLAPFNFIMLGMWWMIGGQFYRRIVTVPAGGAKIVDDGFTARVRLSNISPLAVAVATACGLAFVAIFPIGFTTGFNPPLQVMYITWGVILIGASIAFVMSRVRAGREENDLVIDEAGRRVTLPAGFGRAEPLVILLDKAVAMEVEQVLKTGSKGSTYYRYSPTLVFTDHDGAERREKLAEWSSPTDAADLAAWLRERLRLPMAVENGDTNPKR